MSRDISFHLGTFSLTSSICSCGRRLNVSRLFNKETCQGKTWHIFPSTRANKTCQGETCARVDDLNVSRTFRFPGEDGGARPTTQHITEGEG